MVRLSLLGIDVNPLTIPQLMSCIDTVIERNECRIIDLSLST